MPLEGEGRIEFNGMKYVLRPGFIYFIPPFTRTNVYCPKRLVKYWAHFNARVPNSELDVFTVCRPAEYCFEVDDIQFTEKLFKRLVEIHSVPDSIPPEYGVVEAQSIMTLLVLPFIRRLKTLPGDKDFAVSGTLETLLIHIEEHIAEPLALGELAGVVNLSPNYLSNFFKSEMGIPLIRYRNRHRIRKAISLLWHTDMTVSEVAYRVGIQDLSNFSKMFKKQTGYSPLEFRRSLPKKK
jgi:AraC-like DNA-binding protein